MEKGGTKYMAMARSVEQAILSGIYRLGEKLPSERELCQKHGVTKMTARQAMGVLEEKGLITRQQGRGTFVTLPHGDSAEAGQADSPGPVCLLGLSRPESADRDSVNWPLRMLRFQGIVEMAFRLGLTIETDPHYDLSARADQLINTFKRHSGLIVHDEVLREPVLVGLHELGLPIVAINSYGNVTCCSRIEVDMRGGAYLAVRRLLTLGHRRIGMIVGDPQKLFMRQRLDGYKDALAVEGIPYDESLVVIEPCGAREDGALAARQLLTASDRPSAVFTASDSRALGVLDCADELGLTVPSDLAVVGFDDIDEASYANPPLTTVKNPIYEGGAEAVRLLHQQINQGTTAPQVCMMPMELVVRESCGNAIDVKKANAGSE